MGFTVHRDGFKCAYCKAVNPPAPKTCRNHCFHCLSSMHVDDRFPGDRMSSCKGKMIPIRIDSDAKRGWMIVHKCEKCGVIQRNKAAEDDNADEIIRIAKISAENYWKGE